MPGTSLPDAADAARHGHVDRDHRRALGDAVAFEHSDAELLDPQVAHVFRELFGAGHDVAQTAEVVGMRKFSIVAEKRRCAEQDRAVAVVYQLRNDPVVQRTRIKKHLASGDERHDDAAGEAEGMEQSGSAIMNLSSGVKSASARICATFERIDACECTTPFGLPSEPGGEEHDRGILRGLLRAAIARRKHSGATAPTACRQAMMRCFRSSR